MEKETAREIRTTVLPEKPVVDCLRCNTAHQKGIPCVEIVDLKVNEFYRHENLSLGEDWFKEVLVYLKNSGMKMHAIKLMLRSGCVETVGDASKALSDMHARKKVISPGHMMDKELSENFRKTGWYFPYSDDEANEV